MALSQEKQQAHVLLVAFAAQGHINPMLRLGKRLASKGLRVTLAITEHAYSQYSTTATTASGDVHLACFSDGLPLDYDRGTDISFYMDTLAKQGAPNLRNLIKNHSPPFSCIISNPFVPWAVDVAMELRIPCALFWIQPCTLYAIYYCFYSKLNTFPTENNPQKSVELPGLPLLEHQDLPSFVLPSNTSCFAEILGNVFNNLDKVKWVLANSFYELEKDVIMSMGTARPIWPVGPMVPSSLFGKAEEFDGGLDLYKSEDNCIQWLDKHSTSSVVYISFGSILSFSAKETESIAWALKKTKRPFLWVMKQAEDEKNPPPLSFLEEIKDQGLIVKWSPQTKVLAHPSVGCFLSHCGWNSLSETITAGVPVIAYPQWTDQPTNAKLVADVWKVGVRLVKNEEGVVEGDEVERCVEEVMSGPRSAEFRKNAAELKKAAREAVEDGGTSDRNIQLFVDEIRGAS